MRFAAVARTISYEKSVRDEKVRDSNCLKKLVGFGVQSLRKSFYCLEKVRSFSVYTFFNFLEGFSEIRTCANYVIQKLWGKVCDLSNLSKLLFQLRGRETEML